MRRKKAEQLVRLKDGDRIAVVGGGPAGSFFAIRFLRESRRLNRRFDVFIVEKRRSIETSIDGYHLGGCSFSAGGISPRLNDVLLRDGLAVPEEVIEEHIDYVWVHGQWKNFRLRVPEGNRMFAVFRGSMPSRRGAAAMGFDEFLLGKAVEEGARILNAEVRSVSYSQSGMPCLTLKMPSGGQELLDADFAVFASGINAHCGRDYGESELIASIRHLNPAFFPARSRRAVIFELDMGGDYLKLNMHREVHFVEYGSKRLDLEHIALLPKGRYLSVVLIGRSIDEAVLPHDNRRIIDEFVRLPQIRRILPGVENAPLACACFPRMAVVPARSPYGDRFAVIGDAAGSRLNKDGLFSAHVTASRLAHTILHEGVSEEVLAKEYGRVIKWLADDNRYGRIVFGASRIAFSWPWLSRVTYQSFATEFKWREEKKRPMSDILWKIASGTADYGEILREMIAFSTVRAILNGAAVTVRNVAVEQLLGLKWGMFGRYPTVVLMEKRREVKRYLSARPGIQLDESPDFERMYVIKIRGPAAKIVEELAKFGRPDAKFLNLRFISVRHVGGEPNEVGSVIQYRVPFTGIGTELRLAKRAGFGTFLYQLDERLGRSGKLVFDISPTKDGNNKLSIYAAFDYKRGKTPAGRVLWSCARLFFPEFVHDVVWNHALCTIKEEVEK